MKTIILPYGREKITITIPKRNLLKICLLKETPGVKDNVKAIKETLNNPIGSPTIPKIAQGKRTAVVIRTDIR